MYTFVSYKLIYTLVSHGCFHLVQSYIYFTQSCMLSLGTKLYTCVSHIYFRLLQSYIYFSHSCILSFNTKLDIGLAVLYTLFLTKLYIL